jgi:hypothetical protein
VPEGKIKSMRFLHLVSVKKQVNDNLDLRVDQLTNSVENMVARIRINNKKQKSKELEVDFIGGERPLTKAEEEALSEHIRQQRQSAGKNPATQLKTAKRKKVVSAK